MNHEAEEDMRRARLYLSLAPDELQNVYAETRKREAQRKAAIVYGDKGSNVEPVTFVPPACKECMDPIVYANTSPDQGTCLWCYRSKTEKPKPKPIPWSDVAWVCLVIVGAVGLVAWVVVK